MRDELPTELEIDDPNVKTGAWNAYEVWKTTIHEPRNERLTQDKRSLGERLDEEEDRQRSRVRKLRRVVAILLLLVASGIGLFVDRYLSSTPEQSHTELALRSRSL